ncbi:hypothetical protein RCL_jg27772.t1 [Rhizophagus clarus]|uniref:Uncharacterized protein n=1 Tax=Rhizophagus clarus TaxID=94130 RepID=A0A8H3L8E0_9GLOM|nr:hypothetical protein RCL_jg27772.t1 [Rhizophagus clarus]
MIPIFSSTITDRSIRYAKLQVSCLYSPLAIPFHIALKIIVILLFHFQNPNIQHNDYPVDSKVNLLILNKNHEKKIQFDHDYQYFLQPSFLVYDIEGNRIIPFIAS